MNDFSKQNDDIEDVTPVDETNNTTADDTSGGADQSNEQKKAAVDEFNDLIDDLKSFINSTATAAAGGDTEKLKQQFQEKFDKVKERVGEQSKTFAQSSKEFSDKAREQLDEGLEHSKEFVKERPLSSVAIAAAGGLLIGLLLSARRNNRK